MSQPPDQQGLERVPPSCRGLLQEVVERLRERFGADLVSVVLFGSVARGTARRESDLDLLLIHNEEGVSHTAFRDVFVALTRRLAEGQETAGATCPLINSVILSEREAQATPYVMLDIVEDGIVLFDPGGFFGRQKARIRARLKELGARRHFLEDGTWYWNLNPRGKRGEVVVI